MQSLVLVRAGGACCQRLSRNEPRSIQCAWEGDEPRHARLTPREPVCDPRSEPLIHAGPRWLLELDDFRAVFTFDRETVYVSTVRGGRVLDPEMVDLRKWPPAPSWLSRV